jgi:hypothetical protein
VNHDAQFVERNSVVGMVGSEACLRQPLKLLCIDLGSKVISVRVMILKGLVDRLDVGRLSRCGRECSEYECCKDRDKSDRLAAPSRIWRKVPRDTTFEKQSPFQHFSNAIARSDNQGGANTGRSCVIASRNLHRGASGSLD